MLTPLFAIAILAQPLAPISKVEQAQGFKLLSGPDAASLWHAYRHPSFPAQGWTAEGSALTHSAGGGGGDLITNDAFADFEVTFQYKVAPKANSGVMYRCTEARDESWQTGPEFQVLDDPGAGVKPDDPHAAAAMYDLYAPPADKKLNPAGEWNDARIYFRNGVVQHWLNGAKTVEARLFEDGGTPAKDWLDKIAGSKFKAYDGFGLQPRGRIALQDHGDEAAFRTIKARDLSAPLRGEKRLFNGKDLTGWEPIVPDFASKHVEPARVWSVQDGILICHGDPADYQNMNPVGYIRTKEKFTNYVLKVEWRFNPVTKKAGNSGVLLRMTGPDKVWPRSVEAQLESGNAGDFWNIDKVTMTVDPARTNGRNTKHTHGAERPIGQWNEYEIIANHGDIVLLVNGEELNRAAAVEETPGYIGLQSEGAEIQFRTIRLVPLD